MLKYQFQEDIFSTIDTLEKSYWIGFLYADGFISKNSATFGVALQERDKQHLINFLRFLKCSENDIPLIMKYSEKTKSYKAALTRIRTKEDLIKLGFTNKKSYDTTLNVWDNIPNNFKKEFILGMWDGDGSFSVTQRGLQTTSLISNNDILINEIAMYINKHLGKDFSKIHFRTPGDPYPRIRFAADKAKVFGDWLYSEGYSFVLQRKYEVYLSFHEVRGKGRSGGLSSQFRGYVCLETGEKYITAEECALKEFNANNPGLMNNIRAVCRGEQKTVRGKHFRFFTEEERKEIKKEYEII